MRNFGCWRSRERDEGGARDDEAEVLDEFVEFAEQFGAFPRLHVGRLHAHEQGAGDYFNIVEEIGHPSETTARGAGVKRVRGPLPRVRRDL